MLRAARIIAGKDLRLMAGRGNAFLHALLLGLLLIVLFSLSFETGEKASPVTAAAMFWLCSAFCLAIVTTALFGLEETARSRLGLLLAPMPVQAVWMGKTLAALVLLAAIQVVFLGATVVFMNQAWHGAAIPALASIVLVDAGAVALGTLMAALSRGQAARESIAALVLFPLLVPQLLAGIRMLAPLYDAAGGTADAMRWFGFAASFDAVFIGAALLLFPVIYGGD